MAEQHHGVIRLSPNILKYLLHLPEGYEVETFHIDSLYNELRLYVTSPTLPKTEEFQQLPDVELRYKALYDEEGKRLGTELSDIKVTTYPAYSKEEVLQAL